MSKCLFKSSGHLMAHITLFPWDIGQRAELTMVVFSPYDNTSSSETLKN